VLRIRAIRKKGDRARVAIIAAKKYYRTKITRNIFKRRVFSVLQKELPKLDTTLFGFFLVFPVVHTQDITFAAIASDIAEFMDVLNKQHAY
jgi:ribonuclease P protein component